MSTTKTNTKAVAVEEKKEVIAPDTKKADTKKAETKQVDTKPASKEKKTEPKADTKTKTEKQDNKEKKNVAGVKQMKNSELQKLFTDNGCLTKTKANDASDVVYNTFGTKSRVLQQKRGYQLLLTNGHKKVKEHVVESDNDDAKRFDGWYKKLSKDEQAKVSGIEGLFSTKLSDSELPRERTVKITDFDLLVKFIQFMGSFDENKVVAAK